MVNAAPDNIPPPLPLPTAGEGKSARQNANNPRWRGRGYTAPVTPPIFTLKARAEQMRRDGVPVHEVARAVGRSPSTIYGWAAQGGWRVEDLEAEGFRESPAVPAPPGAAFPLPLMGRVGDPSGSAGWGDGNNAANPHPTPTPPHEGEGKHSTEPLTPLEAARQLHQRSADLAAAGQIRPAEAAARLADRILRTEYLLGRVGGAAAPETPEADAEDIRAELAERFRRVIQHYHERRAAGDPDPGGGVPLGFHRIAEANGCSLDEVMGWPPVASEG